ncbi:MAG: cation transporter [Verrucomicrobia bacterium]|nr:cation transporter [Verrucomicrobiota bacterium]
MSKNPHQSFLPSSVQSQREKRRKEILSTVLRGIWLRLIIILAEISGFFYLNSSSLLLDGLSSFLDIGASLLLMLCVHLADKPPDRHHPLGHGRFEPVAGFQLGVFLVIVGGYLGIQQCIAATKETSLQVINPYTWVIPLVAMILLEIGYQHLKKTAKKQNSSALFADAIHYRIDGISSFLAVLALALGAYFPKYSLVLDHIGACLIALFLIGIGIKAALENLHPLLDRVPDEIYFRKVQEAAMRVEGVKGTEKLRIQSYGPDALVSIDIEVDPSLTVEVAHSITQKVRLEIQTSWPAVRDVIVHVEPYHQS